MLISQYFVEFIFYSFLGWIWESIYCTTKEKRWSDRGFLFGPVCPIYGTCVVIVSIGFKALGILSSPTFPLWAIFIICYIVSAVAEYSTSWVLEKRFHARWWDYSDLPLNLHGRICVLSSIAFGLAGVLIVKYLIPAAEGWRDILNPMVYEVLAMLFAGLLGADIALTEASISSLLTEVEKMHEEFNEKAQKNYELARVYAEKLSFNQKRILLGIQRFIPKKGKIYRIPLFHLTDALSESVRDLRKKKD